MCVLDASCEVYLASEVDVMKLKSRFVEQYAGPPSQCHLVS